MERAELIELLSGGGLSLLNSMEPYRSADDILRTVERLRANGHSASLVAAVLNQAKLRTRARSKFGPFTDQLLFTESGLEQATRLDVAAQHAGRFTRAGLTRVADLGCGIGADALAIAALELEVTAVEQDEVTAAVAAYNLAPFSHAQVEQADALAFDLSGVDGVYLDPARRTGSRRRTDPRDWSPSLDFAFDLANRFPTGIKMGPGVDRDLIPAEAEAQWVSHHREVVELGLWFGALARPGIKRSALVMSASGTAELTAAADSVDEPVGGLGGYLYEPDGAVIRARLIGDVVRSLNGRMIDDSIAYFTADAAHANPFATCFRVLAEFSLDRRVIKRELAARGVGVLEIKKRGVDVDPAQFRSQLALAGDATGTLVLTRLAGRRRALLVERVTPEAGSNPFSAQYQ